MNEKQMADDFFKLSEDKKKEHLKTLTYQQVWTLIIAIGRQKEPSAKGVANKLDKDDVTTIIANMEFFGATDIWMQQTYFDLTTPRFRVFDFLGMSVSGRNNDNRKQNNLPLKVLVWSYLKSNGDVIEFIKDLRETDYQIDNSYDCVPEFN